MLTAKIQQAIHGYRNGHRQLSSSISLGAESARAMLVLSDMSGPAMQPGFDEYLTGYPLPGSDLFVLAKTWYAPEMQRPGCVWTHSFLLSREQVSRMSVLNLTAKFRRPQKDDGDGVADSPMELDLLSDPGKADDSEDMTVTYALIGAVLGQPRPVIVAVENASQLELPFLRLWDELWPSARWRFSFCTGALLPRSVAGAMMDLQAVPRAIPSSQFRRSVGAAVVLDLHDSGETESWVKRFLEEARGGGRPFLEWFDVAGPDASRGLVPLLLPIFETWHEKGAPARSVLDSILNAKDIEPGLRGRLVGKVFERTSSEVGGMGSRELLQEVCTRRDVDLLPIAAAVEGQAKRLFQYSRSEGVALVLSLVGGDLTAVGERVLRAVVPLLTPNDLETFEDSQTQYLPTLVRVNPELAFSSVLWNRVGNRSEEVLAHLGSMNVSEEDRERIVECVLSSGNNVSAEGLIRFGGKAAIYRVLVAIKSGQIDLSWPWRSSLAGQSNAVLDWLESLSCPSLRDLDVVSRVLSPKGTQSRLVAVWKSGIGSPGVIASRVAAFGLALAFWEGNVKSPLFAACFQPTYDAAGNSRLEYDEWDWIREYAPSISIWRDWDKCERIAKAMALQFEKQHTSLETVFEIVHSRSAMRKITALLDDDRDTRSYLKSLRKAAGSSSIGTHDQREALLEDW